MVQLVDLDNMSGPPYLCVFHLATAGQQGPNLGSDEEEIVAMIYVVIDKALNKVVGIQQYLVKPNVANTNESFLSSEILLETSITEDLVRKSLPLEYVILQFDTYVRSLQIDPYQIKFVTDGELPLRQCLHPEACNKNIELPEYYNSFIDLRKDFKAFYSSPDDLGSVREMIECHRKKLERSAFEKPKKSPRRWRLVASLVESARETEVVRLLSKDLEHLFSFRENILQQYRAYDFSSFGTVGYEIMMISQSSADPRSSLALALLLEHTKGLNLAA